LWEKVAPKAPDEGFLSANTPHPNEPSADAGDALSHKGRGRSNYHRIRCKRRSEA